MPKFAVGAEWHATKPITPEQLRDVSQRFRPDAVDACIWVDRRDTVLCLSLDLEAETLDELERGAREAIIEAASTVPLSGRIGRLNASDDEGWWEWAPDEESP
jgi:hypothetical protein